MTNQTDEIYKISQNMAQIADRSSEVIKAFLESQGSNKENIIVSNQMNIANSFMEILTKIASDPEKLMDIQMAFYKDYVSFLNNYTAQIMGEDIAPIYKEHKKDRRFKDSWWDDNFLFHYLKQSYFLVSDVLEKTADEVDDDQQKKLKFYTKQFIDAISPSNFAFTNPEVVRETIASNGENLVKGLQNLLEDIKKSKGHFKISLTDSNAFTLGKDIATTKGKVVHQNELVQLIKYSPTTKQVYENPVFIVSPWINKYYILDLHEKNSYVKWLVDKGYTVFITSWVNPDEKLAHITFDDYVALGTLDCLDAIEKTTGSKQTNIIGYCLGGTLTAATMAYLTEKNEANRISSVSYLTTLVDFSESGDLGIFVNDDALAGLEGKVSKDGIFHGNDMAYIFSMLRSKELIWSFVIHNYLMGKSPIPFDMLYWNADSTGMPASMHLYYLKNMYRNNLLIKPNALTMLDVPIDLSKIKIPAYIISTKEDHIAPWIGTYKSTQVYNSEIRFVLSGSGHVAGVVNPPRNNKYGYQVADIVKDYPKNPQDWLKSTTAHEGSWWLDWDKWMQDKGFAGKEIPASKAQNDKIKAIEDAPGSYVLKRL